MFSNMKERPRVSVKTPNTLKRRSSYHGKYKFDIDHLNGLSKSIAIVSQLHRINRLNRSNSSKILGLQKVRVKGNHIDFKRMNIILIF